MLSRSSFLISVSQTIKPLPGFTCPDPYLQSKFEISPPLSSLWLPRSCFKFAITPPPSTWITEFASKVSVCIHNLLPPNLPILIKLFYKHKSNISFLLQAIQWLLNWRKKRGKKSQFLLSLAQFYLIFL